MGAYRHGVVRPPEHVARARLGQGSLELGVLRSPPRELGDLLLLGGRLRLELRRDLGLYILELVDLCRQQRRLLGLERGAEDVRGGAGPT